LSQPGSRTRKNRSLAVAAREARCGFTTNVVARCYSVSMVNFSPFLILLAYIALFVWIVWQVISALNRMSRAFEDIAYTARQYTKWRMESKGPQPGS